MRKNIQLKVKAILENNKTARDSDVVLISELFKEYGYECKTTMFSTILRAMYDGYLPTFESITRARRKIQELYPELQASQDIQFTRLIEQENYRETYGKGGN